VLVLIYKPTTVRSTSWQNNVTSLHCSYEFQAIMGNHQTQHVQYKLQIICVSHN